MSRPSIVVIGAGLAGSLVCNELVGRANVTLLEIGEKDRIHYPPVRFDRKPLAHVNTFCFGGGGTTNLWHNGLIPINPSDVASIEFRTVLEASKSFADEAARQLFFPGASYGRAYQDAVAEANATASAAGLAGDGVDCLIYPKRFHKLTVDERVSDVYSVTSIGFVADRGRVTKVTYRVGTVSHEVNVSSVVVAAGALSTPRILRELLSALGKPLDGVGTGFIDHPIGFVGKVRFKPEAAAGMRRLSLADKGDYVVRTAIRLKSLCGKYTCGAFLRPAATIDNNLAIYKYKSLLGAATGTKRIRNAFSWKLFHPDIAAEVVSHLLGAAIPGRTFNILLIAEQRRGVNRVYYDGDQLRVDWSITSEELAVYRSLLERLGDLLRPIAEEVNVETSLTDEWLWSGAHHSGTVSLGTGDSDLLNHDLMLKMCENVYVCDGSVIQEHSYANTGLTIGQLAIRLARHLVA